MNGSTEPKTIHKTAPYLLTSGENREKTIQKPENRIENPPSLVPDISEGKQLAFLRHKREYRAFLKLIKANKFTTAIYTSKLLGVSDKTISTWLKTPLAIKSMQETTSKYISSIESSKDWKAKAYLLDKLEGNKEEQQQKADLKQLIVINT